MKTLTASVAAAVVASACCLGPVVFTAAGAGALSAAAVSLEPLRPWFLGLTGLLLAAGVYSVYGRSASEDCAIPACPPSSRALRRTALWIVAAIVAVIAAFPYYADWFM